MVLDLYPCDILFVHRDAEAQPPENRRSEIEAALHWSPNRWIPVIPVRMTESWLLFDERAIRSAAGNPNGTEPLNLPEVHRLELLPDPKALLSQLLKTASGLNSRRRSRLPVHERVHRIPDYIDDFSTLLRLPSFQRLQADIQSAIENISDAAG
ncbi:MAG: hypothetical protein SGI92_22665 [Bryobacteraceae bacterium]|nr:hypothetical protein [Bryobacteraceae bacterium]